jgi:PAS domain S-box-containing protein
MLAQEIDFHEMFKIHPTGMVLLSADLVILDANDEFLSTVGRKLEDVIGHNFYDEFPKLPEDPGGRPKWTALDEAMTSGRRQYDRLIRYDLEDPDRPGVFVEHWITTVAQPIRGCDGQVQVIELSVRDITPIIEQYQAQCEDDVQLDKQL